mgnify:FL=1
MNNVDKLGMLMAQIADLEAQANKIKDEIKNAGEGYYDGSLFRANVSLSQRAVVDNKAVFADAHVPAEIIEKHTRTTAIITLKVTAR